MELDTCTDVASHPATENGQAEALASVRSALAEFRVVADTEPMDSPSCQAVQARLATVLQAAVAAGASQAEILEAKAAEASEAASAVDGGSVALTGAAARKARKLRAEAEKFQLEARAERERQLRVAQALAARRAARGKGEDRSVGADVAAKGSADTGCSAIVASGGGCEPGTADGVETDEVQIVREPSEETKRKAEERAERKREEEEERKREEKRKEERRKEEKRRDERRRKDEKKAKREALKQLALEAARRWESREAEAEARIRIVEMKGAAAAAEKEAAKKALEEKLAIANDRGGTEARARGTGEEKKDKGEIHFVLEGPPVESRQVQDAEELPAVAVAAEPRAEEAAVGEPLLATSIWAAVPIAWGALMTPPCPGRRLPCRQMRSESCAARRPMPPWSSSP
eukprot:CAMPEP_0117464948 /NCGR_PEP_ID=MMETSP0784-20121206/4373_1 /TAXON_ID=39447 /ORGANISM="" /LENGTH=404 /DNA_ID=CAMNT_0005258841 /DNA_START=171 /DNA_END=1384 /DNA_ORIENTATION=-